MIFFAPQPQERLADFYAAADVVLVPSRSESFGLVALEAGACGTPVVAAAVGGLRHVVADGVTGLLVEGHDPGEHADAALRILRSPGLQSAIGRDAAHAALRFTWDVTTDEVASVYGELLSSACRSLSCDDAERSPARRLCHSFSRGPDLHVCGLTCGNVGLTPPGAADTFRIASSGPSDRDEETGRAAPVRKRGGDAGRAGPAIGRRAARSSGRTWMVRPGGGQPGGRKVIRQEEPRRRSGPRGPDPATRTRGGPRGPRSEPGGPSPEGRGRAARLGTASPGNGRRQRRTDDPEGRRRRDRTAARSGGTAGGPGTHVSRTRGSLEAPQGPRG